MKKIRIVQLIWAMNEGGAQSLVRDYVLNINRDLFEVSIISVMPKLNDVYLRSIEEAGIKVKYIYKKWGLVTRGFHRKFGEKYIPFKLRRFMKELEPDIIHIHLYGLRHLKKIEENLNQTSLLFTCHNNVKRSFPNQNTKDYKAAKHFIETGRLSFIALHNEMKNELDNAFNTTSTVVLENGADLKRFIRGNIPETTDEIRLKNNIPTDAFVIGNIGRFSVPKNHEFILSVFKACYEKNSNAFLLLIGSGEKKEYIINKTKEMGLNDRTMVLSNRSDIPELLKAMDVFLFPSLYEGFPVTLIEAQASGLPCVISDTITKDSIRTNRVISLSLKTDINTWCEQVLTFKSNHQIRNDLEKCDSKFIVAKLEDIYRQVLNE